MTRDETGQLLAYDAWGRLVTVNTDGTGGVEITNLYDALNRWIKRNSNEFYYTAEWQQIEEADAQGVEAQQVWSSVYIDAMVLRDRDSDNDGVMEATDERLYVVHDANFNITSLIKEDGTWQVIERFIYDAYGTRSVLDANWSADSDNTSDYGFSHGHQGGLHDLLAKAVYFRERWLFTNLGRWNRQDPLGYVDGLNLFVTVLANPTTWKDPSGLACSECPVTILRFVAKSHISRIGTSYGIVRGGRNWLLPAVAAATDAAYNENPGTPCINGRDYRLFSGVKVAVTCCDDDIDTITPIAQGSNVGREPEPYGIQPPPGFWYGEDIAHNGKHGMIHWGFAGRPDFKVEPMLAAVKPRGGSVYIWHEVIIQVKCVDGKAQATSSLDGSGFPSHTLWVNGKPSRTLTQGPLSALWQPCSDFPVRIR